MATAAEKLKRLSKITNNISDLEHQEVPKTLYVMGFGSHGTGKTTALMALAQKVTPAGKEIFLGDSSEGWVSLDTFPSLKKRVRRYRIEEPADLMLIANAILLKKKGFENVGTVVIDEGSSIFTRMLHDYVRELNGLGPDDDLPEIDGKDYAAPGAAFLSMVNTFMRIPDVNFFMVAHEQGRNVQGEANQKRMAPSFGPKLTNDLAQLMHVIGRFESRSVKGTYERDVQSWPTRYVEAKSRISTLEVKESSTTWVKKVAEWRNSSHMQEDLVKPQKQGLADEPVEGPDDETVGTEDDDDFEVTDDD